MKFNSPNPNRKPWSIPEECKEEIREMLSDGLTPRNVAWYIGVSVGTVQNIQDPKKYRAARREYDKKYHFRIQKKRNEEREKEADARESLAKKLASNVFGTDFRRILSDAT